MKIFVLLLSSSYSLTDCGSIHQEWYGTPCSNTVCHGTYACVVPQACDEYQCVQNGFCPDGLFYLPYYPTGSSDQAGWACFPIEHVTPPTFHCNFGDGPDYRLSVAAKVNGINKQAGHLDDRNVTLISLDAWEQADDSDGPVLVFDSSQCQGTIVGKLVIYQRTAFFNTNIFNTLFEH